MNAHNNPRQITVERRGERTPHKPKPWSHQLDLQRLRSKPVTLMLASGALKTGVLVEADQFTLKIEITHSSSRRSILTFFKHALVSYSPADAADQVVS